MVAKPFSEREAVQWFQRNKKNITGSLYGIGDIAISARGTLIAINEYEKMQAAIKGGALADAAVSKDKMWDQIGETATGMGYLTAAGIMGGFGNWPIDKQLDTIQQKMANFFAEKGIELTPEYVEHQNKHDRKSFGDKLIEFFYKHPTDILNATYFAFTIPLLRSGYNKAFVHGGEKGTFGSAVMIMAGALTGILLKSKPKEIGKESKSGILNWVRDKPNLIAGSAYLVNNYFTGVTAKDDLATYAKESITVANKNINLNNLWMLRAVQTATYGASNGIFMTTSRGSEADHDLLMDLRQAMLMDGATMIKHQPEKLQPQLINQLANHFSQSKALNFNKSHVNDIRKEIHKAIENVEMVNSPIADKSWATLTREKQLAKALEAEGVKQV